MYLYLKKGVCVVFYSLFLALFCASTLGTTTNCDCSGTTVSITCPDGDIGGGSTTTITVASSDVDKVGIYDYDLDAFTYVDGISNHFSVDVPSCPQVLPYYGNAKIGTTEICGSCSCSISIVAAADSDESSVTFSPTTEVDSGTSFTVSAAVTDTNGIDTIEIRKGLTGGTVIVCGVSSLQLSLCPPPALQRSAVD